MIGTVHLVHSTSFCEEEQSGYQFANRLYSFDYEYEFAANLKEPILIRFYRVWASWTYQTVDYRPTEWAKTRVIRLAFRHFVGWKLNKQREDILDEVESTLVAMAVI